jgi:hypothetical protein
MILIFRLKMSFCFWIHARLRKLVAMYYDENAHGISDRQQL